MFFFVFSVARAHGCNPKSGFSHRSLDPVDLKENCAGFFFGGAIGVFQKGGRLEIGPTRLFGIQLSLNFDVFSSAESKIHIRFPPNPGLLQPFFAVKPLFRGWDVSGATLSNYGK